MPPLLACFDSASLVRRFAERRGRGVEGRRRLLIACDVCWMCLAAQQASETRQLVTRIKAVAGLILIREGRDSLAVRLTYSILQAGAKRGLLSLDGSPEPM